jgi:hypothetical protein
MLSEWIGGPVAVSGRTSRQTACVLLSVGQIRQSFAGALVGESRRIEWAIHAGHRREPQADHLGE